jgi:hypothetical protein
MADAEGMALSSIIADAAAEAGALAPVREQAARRTIADKPIEHVRRVALRGRCMTTP